jgi:hypothetical protein
MGQTQYESFDTGDNGQAPVGGSAWYAQSFTPDTAHEVFRVVLYAAGDDIGGQTLNVEIWSTDGDGHPLALLCSGTYDTDNLGASDAPAWHTIDLDSTYSLEAGTKYAIVCYQSAGDTYWRWASGGGYSGGTGMGNLNSGSSASWSDSIADLLFEEWGLGPHTLTVTTVGTGIVAEGPNQATHVHNSTVTLTAYPGNGWSFGSWSGDMAGSTNPDDIVMDDDKTVTATFTEDPITRSRGGFVG